ncbi:hypothetical protein AAJ76_490001264 [Vairimorpha ceranae]|uniref:Uncharacterized protein n=1 Tax=Vairimorpha ceranae TaxID=40302 RepID=A0A0F9WNY9_9MICR|nr:hypothetical protein AAJ76_490001264 [Vairimorpha ceranae]KKO74713.1 hypothetical protein AAJ76_490001264 [Vairimorpha ceranae]
MKQCFIYYYLKKNNYKKMLKKIRKLIDLRHHYVINSFIEKYYKFGSYPSGQDTITFFLLLFINFQF